MKRARCNALLALVAGAATVKAFVPPVAAPAARDPRRLRQPRSSTELPGAAAGLSATRYGSVLSAQRDALDSRGDKIRSDRLGGGGGGGGGSDSGGGIGGDGGATPAAASWDVKMELGDEVRMVRVRAGDSLLEAAELAGLQAGYDCRRGNCITCAAQVLDGAPRSLEMYIRRRDGGRDPDTFLCAEAKQRGYVLACSAYAVGPGLHVKLGMNTEAWKVQYAERFQDRETQRLLQEASAGVMRAHAERHPEQWRAALEKQIDEPPFEPGGGGGDGDGCDSYVGEGDGGSGGSDAA